MPDMEEYRKAQKMGLREYRSSVAAGIYPYPQVLDDILQNTGSTRQESLGVVDIPLELIKGTRSEGRKTAFSLSFLPLLRVDTEFAVKWANLFQAQMEEGIRDPIQAYEFMGRFYVEEGNKRVSVMAYLGAVSISGQVTRLVPPKTGSVQSILYYEYMDFYRDTGINYLIMTRPGSYRQICRQLNIQPGTPWTPDQRADFYSAYYRFRKVYRQSPLEGVTVGEALVTYLSLYPYRELSQLSDQALGRRLARLRPELQAAGQDPARTVAMKLEPHQEPALSAPARLLEKLYAPKLKVAFLYEKEPGTSPWTAAHEFGRCQAGETMGDRVETYAYPNVEVGVNDQEMVEQAIAKGCSIIFTTTPKLMQTSLKAAVEHPEIKFLNCSLNMPYPSVKTYYMRVYEAKFLLGAIAGAMTPDGKIGYLAQYPIYGALAEINAFALGAAMVNQQARIYLRWSCVDQEQDPEEWFLSQGIRLICHRDMSPPSGPDKQFGLYRVREDGTREGLAAPFWHWGRYYERLLELLLGRVWPSRSQEVQAVNYWWGMASGVVDLLTSRSLPAPVARLSRLLKEGIKSGELDPFDLPLTDQAGTLRHEGGSMAPEAILHMDWLLDRVEGSLPRRDQLIPAALPLVELQGILPQESQE